MGILRRRFLDPYVWLVFFSLQVPALRALVKYTPRHLLLCIPPVLAVAWVFCAVVVESVRRGGVARRALA